MRAQITPKKVASDVVTVQQNALAVLTIDSRGIQISQNLQGRLGVVAVVGPGKILGTHFDEAVLTEIGLRSTLPYSRSSGANFLELRNKNGEGRKDRQGNREIPARHPWFSPTFEQYRSVAPLLFQTIQDLSEIRMSLREVRGTEVGINIFRTSSEKVQRKGKAKFVRHRDIPQVVRVSFPRKEIPMIQDVLWAERHKNPWRAAYLREFADWITEWLEQYEKNGYQGDFLKLKGFQGVQRLFWKSPLPYHLKIDALQYLPGGRQYRFYAEVTEMLSWYGESTREHTLITSAQDPESRVRDLRVHTLGYRGNILVAQVHKRSREERDGDDLPF